MNQDDLTKKDLTVICLVIFISMFGIFVSDIFLPALPGIQVDLDTTQTLLEFSIPMYFLMFSLSQLIFGPLSEVYGRRRIVLVGLSIGLMGSFIVLFSISIEMLLLGRAIEAIGLSAPMTLGRVIVRDKIKEDKLFVKVSSYMGAAILLAPVIAPLFGGFLTIHWGWRSNFVFLVCINIACITLVLTMLEETLLTSVKRISAKLTMKTFAHILNHKQFVLNVLISAMFMGGILSYLALSSFLFQETLGLTVAQFSWTFAICDAFIVVGMLLNPRIIDRYGISRAIFIGVCVGLFAGIIFVCMCLLECITLLSVMLPVVIFNFSAGMVFPTSGAAALISFKKRLGAVGALFGSSQMMIAAFISTISTQVPFKAENVLAFIFLSVALCAMISYLILYSKKYNK